MTRPRFSVIIPTKNRSETLAFCLQTCLAQQYDDYEIVVCDNCSPEATRQVVERANSSRIVYHRSATPLLMADNWNLAFSLASGEFVIFLGDDDGLMPYALRQLDHVLRTTGVRAATWEAGVYTWPNILRTDQANWLQFRVVPSLEVVDGRRAIQRYLSGDAHPVTLPNIYHGVASREVLDAIRSTSGYIAIGQGPDTYSSFAVAYKAETYAQIRFPMSISGFSAASATGSFSMTNSKQGAARQTWVEIQKSASNRLHPLLPDLLSPAVVVADSFLSAKRDLFPDDEALDLDWKALIDRVLARLPIDDITEWPAVVSDLRRAFEDRPDLLGWLDDKLARMEPEVPPRVNYVLQRRGFFDHHLCVHAPDLGAFDVRAAVDVAARVLGVGEAPIEWSAQPALDVERLGGMSARLKELRSARAAASGDVENELYDSQIESIRIAQQYGILARERVALGKQLEIAQEERISMIKNYDALLKDRIDVGKQYERLLGEYLRLQAPAAN